MGPRNKSEVYIREDEASLINHSGQFVYEVSLFITHEGILSLANHKLFYSDKPINKVRRLIQYSKFIEIYCELYSAPKSWLIENGFTLYIKPKKIKKDEQKSLSVE